MHDLVYKKGEGFDENQDNIKKVYNEITTYCKDHFKDYDVFNAGGCNDPIVIKKKSEKSMQTYMDGNGPVYICDEKAVKIPVDLNDFGFGFGIMLRAGDDDYQDLKYTDSFAPNVLKDFVAYIKSAEFDKIVRDFLK